MLEKATALEVLDEEGKVEVVVEVVVMVMVVVGRWDGHEMRWWGRALGARSHLLTPRRTVIVPQMNGNAMPMVRGVRVRYA